jgi:hypothetical protein
LLAAFAILRLCLHSERKKDGLPFFRR